MLRTLFFEIRYERSHQWKTGFAKANPVFYAAPERTPLAGALRAVPLVFLAPLILPQKGGKSSRRRRGDASPAAGDAAPPVAKRPPKGRCGGTFRGGRNAGAQRAESRSYTRRTGGSRDTAMQITVSTPMERAL